MDQYLKQSVPTSQVFWVLVLCASMLAGWIYVSRPTYVGTPGVDIKATHNAMDAMADRLISADKKGDIAAANGMLDGVRDLLDKIDAGTKTNPALRRCSLAAAHLADGVLSVMGGGTWHSKSRFQNALEDCK